MPPHHSSRTLVWERLPWEAVLRSSCPKRLSSTVVERTQSRGSASTMTRPERKHTARRREMFDWLNGPGKVFEKPAENFTNYLGAYDREGQMRRKIEMDSGTSRDDQDSMTTRERTSDLRPFPLNLSFHSESVLSDALREEVYQQVLEHDMDVSSVSAAYGIDKRRVAAVVRMKAIEKRWLEEGKPLAKPYNDAVLSMLPLTGLRVQTNKMSQHEAINEIPVHAATRNQIFCPVPESRQFNRVDAAKAFSSTLLPADDRIAHPELVDIARWKLKGLDVKERNDRLKSKLAKARANKEEAERKQAAYEAERMRTVPGKRWDFKFRNISVESAGHNGMNPNGVGIRYGMPHDDRKRGKYKLPTSVE